MRPPRPLDDQVGAGEALPSTGPPRPWIQQYGPTPDCTACTASSIDMVVNTLLLAVDVTGTGYRVRASSVE